MDFFDGTITGSDAAAIASMSNAGATAPANRWDGALTGMPSLSTPFPGFAPPPFPGASDETAKMSGGGMAGMMDLEMDIPFDPQLLDMPVELLLGTGSNGTAAAASNTGTTTDPGADPRGIGLLEMESRSATASGPRPGVASGSSVENGPDGDAASIETDLSKVVIAVEGCDKEMLDYLFNVTRPIKGRVKMEITR